jgi:hypothetical protein
MEDILDIMDFTLADSTCMFEGMTITDLRKKGRPYNGDAACFVVK